MLDNPSFSHQTNRSDNSLTTIATAVNKSQFNYSGKQEEE